MPLNLQAFVQVNQPFLQVTTSETLASIAKNAQSDTMIVVFESGWRFIKWEAIASFAAPAMLADVTIGQLALQRVGTTIAFDTDTLEEDILLDLEEADAPFLILDGDKVVRFLKQGVNRSASTADVQFSAYYPQTITDSGNLLVYAHLTDMIDVVAKDAAKLALLLNNEPARPRRTRNNTQLRRGSQVTIVPESDELTFNPPQMTIRWDNDWERAAFTMRPVNNFNGDYVDVRISIQVCDIEVSAISLSMDVAQSSTESVLQHSDNSLYQKIFISYSHKDRVIVHRYWQAQQAAGHEIFFDIDTIRSGADWLQAIYNAIDNMDFMQLFWSPHSAASEHVKAEYQYCIKKYCANAPKNCAGKIRPVYWELPVASVPDTLNHLHFKFVDFR